MGTAAAIIIGLIVLVPIVLVVWWAIQKGSTGG